MPRHARAIPLLLLLAIAAIAGHRPAAAADFFVLAVSWQPAFCETRPAKPECVTQDEDRFDASHFALHGLWPRSEEHTSELQSLMRISYAVFCLKKKKQ